MKLLLVLSYYYYYFLFIYLLLLLLLSYYEVMELVFICCGYLEFSDEKWYMYFCVRN